MDSIGRGFADAAQRMSGIASSVFDRNVISRDPFTENQWTGDAFQDTAYDDLFGASTRDAYSASTALTLNDAYNGVGSMLGSWYGPSTFGGSGTGTAPSWQSGLPKLHPWDEDESSQGGYQEIYGSLQGWLADKMPWLYDTPAPITPGAGGIGGRAGTGGADWTNINQYDQFFNEAGAEFGVDPNLLKAMARLESGGAGHAPGGQVLARDDGFGDGLSVGIMQIKPDIWGSLVPGANPYDARDNIRIGAALMAKSIREQGSWQAAITNVYFPANDPNGTTQSMYVQTITGFLSELMAGGGTSGSSGTGAGSLGSIWGNAPGVSESQGFGMTDFSQTPLGQSYYKNFPPEVWGFEGGHSGRDYNMPYGSKLYSPVSGTVIVAGGTAFYYNDGRPGVAGEGDLRIQLDNGDIVVLGHMSRINVQVGQRIDANTFVGLSGRENGDHVHVEYRLYDPSWNGNAEHLRLVDPASALQGGYTEGGALSARQQTAQTFHDVLRLGMTGQLQPNVPIPYGPLSGVGTQGYNPLLHASILGSLGVNGGTVAAGQPLTFPGANAGSGTPANPNPGQAGAATAITNLARQYVGSPYEHAGFDPSGWDCSGFVYWVFGQQGVTIPQGSHAQLNNGQNVSWGSLQPGDLMFFDLTGNNGGARAEFIDGNYASHVGMYLGNGMMIHAANENVGTVIVPVDTPYYTDNFLGGRRYT